jgi:hypothetical protein
MIDFARFYDTYYGHPISDLKTIIKPAHSENKCIIYLAGDSSFDNKYWLPDTNRPRVTSKYRQHSTREYARAKPDVAHWINEQTDDSIVCVNCAVEEAALSDSLNAQDCVIQETITENDVLVVSIGGNDFALKPSILNSVLMASVLYLTPQLVIDWGYAYNLTYIINSLVSQLETYISTLLNNVTPKTLVICTIYYPCLHGHGWADKFLALVGYNTHYTKIHSMIDAIHTKIESNFPNAKCIALSDVLDYTNESDYIQRVEPSETGGRKMATAIINQAIF